jgi:hypothetical protein
MRRLSATIVLAAFPAACGGDSGHPDAGHRRMVDQLARFAQQAAHDNVFFGRDQIDRDRAELERQGEHTPWRTWLDVGTGELKLGNERTGIRVLASAREAMQIGRLATDVDGAVAVSFHLGVAWLRLAETENCCASPSHETCILPIRGTGQHQKKEGATNAAAMFQEVLNNTAPDHYWHLAARWLLNLAHMTLGTWPDGVPERHRLPTSAFAGDGAFPRWRDVAPAVGLDTWGLAGGVVVEDFDGDEWLDLVVSDWSPGGQIRFFRNARDGSWVDATQAAGLTGITGGLNLVHADCDNDGDVDVLVLRGAWWFDTGRWPNSLLRNDGKGHFTDVTFAAGLAEPFLPTQAGAFADFDLDGDLDLYVGNEQSARQKAPSQLFENRGDGSFVDVAARAGVRNDAYAKGVTWGDYDGDRWPDLYVSNTDGDNRLYHNRGDGTFENVAAMLGVTRPAASFPTWFWDFDNDGALDLWVANYDTGIGHIAAHVLGQPRKHELMRLYRGDGKGGFTDVAEAMGLTYPAMPMGSNFGDLDNDGWLDVYLGTGDPQYYTLMPNLLLRNEGGRGFRDVTMDSGMGHLQKGHGVAFADFDGDGDQDVFSVTGGAYPGDAFRNVLFENPGPAGHWLVLRLVGVHENRCAIGARIRVVVRQGDAERSIWRHVNTGGSFGGNPLRQHIGLGAAEQVLRVEVFWPRRGTTQVFTDVPLDSAWRVVEGQEQLAPLVVPKAPLRKR